MRPSDKAQNTYTKKRKKKKRTKKVDDIEGFTTVGEQFAQKRGSSQKEAAEYLKFMGTRT